MLMRTLRRAATPLMSDSAFGFVDIRQNAPCGTQMAPLPAYAAPAIA